MKRAGDAPVMSQTRTFGFIPAYRVVGAFRRGNEPTAQLCANPHRSVDAGAVVAADSRPGDARVMPRTLRSILVVAGAIVLIAVLLPDAKADYRHPIAHVDEWLCIHHFEGSWTDPNPPYFGGLQMDIQFMRTYGGWILAHHGTADHWQPRTQMLVAERAWRTRGFYPWPATARMCGLL